MAVNGEVNWQVNVADAIGLKFLDCSISLSYSYSLSLSLSLSLSPAGWNRMKSDEIMMELPEERQAEAKSKKMAENRICLMYT